MLDHGSQSSSNFSARFRFFSAVLRSFDVIPSSIPEIIPINPPTTTGRSTYTVAHDSSPIPEKLIHHIWQGQVGPPRLQLVQRNLKVIG